MSSSSKFNPIRTDGMLQNHEELVAALSEALQNALSNITYDIRCLDWFSYNPDFYIEQERLKNTCMV